MKTIKFLLVLFFSIAVAACSGGGTTPAASTGGASAASNSVTPSAAINDTGQTLCYDNTAVVACSLVGTHPRQDALFGRDANTALVKTGAGAAGFDFTKVCMNGTLNCNSIASNAAVPVAADWACTKDNHTNLIWSLETQSDTWANATSTLPAAANTASRCGFNTGWRLPTRHELLSIVNNNTSNPSIDTAFFPGTLSNFYWSNDTYAPVPAGAWGVNFLVGGTVAVSKALNNQVRLVRSGQ